MTAFHVCYRDHVMNSIHFTGQYHMILIGACYTNAPRKFLNFSSVQKRLIF